MATEPAPLPDEAEISSGPTSFYIFVPTDETLTVFELVAVKEARDRDHALRLHFGKEPPLSVAVSEHAWRLRKPLYEPRPVGFETVPMPMVAASPDVADDEQEMLDGLENVAAPAGVDVG